MTNIAIRPESLPYLLDQAPGDIEYLSLDCFDTLIWRNVHAPADVFSTMPFPGGAAEPRVWAERMARHVAATAHNRLDVTLDEIHSYMVPESQPDLRAAMIQAELDAEAAHCYAFAPVRDLILAAKQRGLKVMIVSDTYLSEERLRHLIGQAAGADTLALIDRVFVSSQYGVGKAGGLFTHVLKEINVAPGAVLHVGDNPISDQAAPSQLGINTVHLVQFDEIAEQRLRLEAVAGSMIEANTRVTFPVIQGHRPQIAMRTIDDPVFAFGHDVLGPIMYGFVSWLRGEAEAMEAEIGKPVKLLFVMRDGHLPAKAFAALYPDWEHRIASVELSRFTATAASFADKKAIADYLEPVLRPGGKGMPLFAKQLLFDEKHWFKAANAPGNFLERMVRPANAKKIISRSVAFADRLFAHLRSKGVEDGDAVMLVDIGYAGSAQNVIAPVLQSRMNLTVAGRYLLLREMWRAGIDKKGLFDVRNYDFRALYALSEDISILEQFCTIAQGSVVDYEPDGTPIRNAHTVDVRQSACRAQAQEACLRYIRSTGEAMVTPPPSDDADGRRRTAASVLARLLFLPLASEVEMLEDFEHDVNMGTGTMVPMMDSQAATDGLRRRGMFYIKDASRIYLPGELQPHGMPVNLATFASRRFSLDLRKADFNVGGIKLPVTLFDGQGNTTQSIEAYPTAEGYYQALIPIGASRYTVGLRLGAMFEYVQIEEIAFQPVHELMSDRVREVMTPATPIADKMTEIAPGFYHVEAREGFMLVPPPLDCGEMPMLLSLVFRPVVERTGDVVSYQKAA
jgi:FMN phosphatase YigB (HAD superfamily)